MFQAQFQLCDDHAFDERSWDLDTSSSQTVPRCYLLNLAKHDPASGAGSHSLYEIVIIDALALHRDITKRISGGSTYDSDIYWNRFEAEALLAQYLANNPKP